VEVQFLNPTPDALLVYLAGVLGSDKSVNYK
jgi:hypothetical protein